MSTVIKGFKYRIYPTKEQEIQMSKTFGCCRFVYNQVLAKKIELYKSEGKSISKTDGNNNCNRELGGINMKRIYAKECSYVLLNKDFISQVELLVKIKNLHPNHKETQELYKFYYKDLCDRIRTYLNIDFLISIEYEYTYYNNKINKINRIAIYVFPIKISERKLFQEYKTKWDEDVNNYYAEIEEE